MRLFFVLLLCLALATCSAPQIDILQPATADEAPNTGRSPRMS
ncbi:hypothetical protein [Metapseudomonas resinovorans]|nr:hypothetical protein [Pseudomonas resinovorans]